MITFQADGQLVLVVDDDLMVRLAVREALAMSGFRVIDAEDGASALESFEAHRPECVLMDVMMPKMDGFTACSRIREHPDGGHIPILMMTGLDDIESVDRAYQQGATDFITKPLNYALLTHRVRYMLRAKSTADDLRDSEARLAAAQRIAKLGHWEWDARADEIHWSNRINEIYGMPPEMTSGDSTGFLGFVHPDDRDAVRKAVERGVEQRSNISVEHRVVRTDGVERVVYQEAEVDLTVKGDQLRYTGTIQDITDRRRAEEEIRNLAFYDAVTGLANRAHLGEQLERALQTAQDQSHGLAVLSLDLDSFKRINDSLGHSSGDEVLRDIAMRLTRCVRGLERGSPSEDTGAPKRRHLYHDTVARIGGDDFIIVLTGIAGSQDAALAARRIGEALAEPMEINGNEIYVSASIGISVFPDDGTDPETLTKNANSALTHAQEEGRANYAFFASSMNDQATRTLAFETSLRKALDADQFVLHYQPKIDLKQDRVIGVEALVRWQHPELGLVPPGDFIPLAEDSGLIVPLGEWVLRAACEQVKRWTTQGLPPLSVSVNLSAVQFRQSELRKVITDVLRATKLDPRLLELELTESLLMQNTGASVEMLGDLKEVGLDISIDDFGTGYSSLSYLKQFPITALKIDRSFIDDLPGDGDDAAIVSATIALAHSLRIKVVAEGVETPEQLEFLRAKGCDQVQGYLTGRPQDAASFEAWLRERERIPQTASSSSA